MNDILAQAPLILPKAGGSTSIANPDNFKFTTLGDIITKSLFFIFAFAGFALLLMIVAAGFTLLTSAGDAKKMESGKQRLTYAIVGFFIIFSAFWITQIVGKIFGVTEFQTMFQ